MSLPFTGTIQESQVDGTINKLACDVVEDEFMRGNIVNRKEMRERGVRKNICKRVKRMTYRR